MTPTDLTQRLRDAGLRATEPRRATLAALIETPHATAEQVLGLVSDQLARPSIQSVYNTLDDFVAAGIARRIEPAGHPGHYELRVGDNHHHLICRSCGAIVDVDCATGEPPCMHPADSHGYQLDEAEVIYWGLCPRCADGPHS